MTKQQKLTAIIEKGMLNGYNGIIKSELYLLEGSAEKGVMVEDLPDIRKLRTAIPYRLVLFSHDFAKAFWGEEPQKVYGGIWNTYSGKPTTIELHEVPVWQHHLQQAVISDNPIEYYYEHI